MRKNYLLFILFLLIVSVGLVWSVKKINQESPPANNPPIVGNGGIDTSGWIEYRNENIGFRIQHTDDFMIKEGDKFEVDIIGCFILVDKNGNKGCKNTGSMYIGIDNEF